MIRFEGFGWRFAGTEEWAVREVSLHLTRGEFVVIAGPSGSGKTTLALAMCGLLVGRQAGEAVGCVKVNDRDVTAQPLHQTAETIALVQQNPETHFATLTVADELAFGLENRCVPVDEIRLRSREALELLSIAHLADRPLAALSGGEKQRVAVASILAGRPEAVVLDEPTASLDPQASRDLFHAMADLCRGAGLTVVIIEHKLAHLLPLGPRLVWLESGRVVQSGRQTAFGFQLSVLSRGPSADSTQHSALSTQPFIGQDPSASTSEPIVETVGLTVELDGHTILENVSLEVRGGEVVAVLGPNGGGKTTLLHAMLGLVRPARGTIRTCGLLVPQTPVSRLAPHVGLVFQNADHQLVADTVWAEALFAAHHLGTVRPDTEHEAEHLLRLAGLAGRRHDHPYRLSWGQKRRLNVISVLLHGPRLLLLDEPFAGQDWENAHFLLVVLRDWLASSKLNVPSPEFRVPSSIRRPQSADSAFRIPHSAFRDPPARACLLVTHDPRIVLSSCTRLLFIAGGRVVVDAPIPQAFTRLLALGFDAYTPGGRNGEWRMENGE